MRHGEVIDVMGPDLVVPSRGVERLGIHDNCECWGAFLHGESAAPFNSMPPAGPDFPFRFPQLIVSMVHPELWTSAFVLTMELDDDPGTLAEATRILTATGINLIAVDASPTAFHQVGVVALAADRGLTESMRSSSAIVHATSAVDDASRAVSQFEPGRREPEFREAQRHLERVRRALMQEIGRVMIPAMARLRLEILTAEHDLFDRTKGRRPRGFLRSRVVEYGDRPYFLSDEELGGLCTLPSTGDGPSFHKKASSRAFTSKGHDEGPLDSARRARKVTSHEWYAEQVRQGIDAHLAPAIQLQATHHLAHAAVWRIRYDRDGQKDRFARLRYIAPDMRLRLLSEGEEQDTFADRLRRFYVRPRMEFSNAIVAFDRGSAMLRVRFLRAEYMRRCAVRVLIDYAKSSGAPAALPDEGLPMESVGMLHHIAESARSSSFDLLRVSSRLLTCTQGEESGQVRLTMVHQSLPPRSLEEKLGRLRNELTSTRAKANGQLAVSIAPFGWPIAVLGPGGGLAAVAHGIRKAIAVCEGSRADLLVAHLNRGAVPEVAASGGFDALPAYGLVQVIAIDPRRHVGTTIRRIEMAMAEADRELAHIPREYAVGRVFVDPVPYVESEEHPREILTEVEMVAGEGSEEENELRVAQATIHVILKVAEEVRASRRTPSG